MDLNKILIDWFAYSAQTPSKSEFEEVKKAEENLLLFELKECMGLDNEFVVFQELPGMYFYKSRHAFNGISFLFDGMREDMGVCCQMSGKGCRTFETFGNGDYESLFNRCVHYSGMNISRIDIAYDDFEGIWIWIKFAGIPMIKVMFLLSAGTMSKTGLLVLRFTSARHLQICGYVFTIRQKSRKSKNRCIGFAVKYSSDESLHLIL